MSSQRNTIAVLTGDLLGSTNLNASQIEAAFEALGTCASMIENWSGGSLHFTRQKGDGWQAVLRKPEFALRAAMCLRAALRQAGAAFETYISIATGPAPDHIAPDLNTMNHPLFIQSGRQLDTLKDNAKADGILIRDWMMSYTQATGVLADHISQGWTPAQAAAILAVLRPNTDPSYTEVAERLGKSRQVVTKSLKAAGKAPLLSALQTLENALTANRTDPQ